MEIAQYKPRVIAFDWGDTLMKVFPMPAGPMVDWPEVAAVEGALECLQALHGRFQIVVATNASESSAQEVRAALDRVGLGEWIDGIFTVKELGTSKLEPGYYKELEEQLGERREHLVMVGDHYLADVLNPWLAGWNTAWLNPSGMSAPGMYPVQSIDLAHLSDLPAALPSLALPSVNSCLAWLQEQRAPRVLISHVEGVAAAAYQMALWLRQAGQPVNPILAHRGGLLHDLAKLLEDEERGPDHGELAAGLLAKAGQAELASIAFRHMLFGVLEEGRQPRTWEEKLVYLADKLVEGSQFVMIEARLEALRKRYQIDPALLGQVETKLRVFQDQVCTVLNCSPQELVTRLQQAARGTLATAGANG